MVQIICHWGCSRIWCAAPISWLMWSFSWESRLAAQDLKEQMIHKTGFIHHVAVSINLGDSLRGIRGSFKGGLAVDTRQLES